MASRSNIFLQLLVIFAIVTTCFAKQSDLSSHYYENVCPKALETIEKAVKKAVRNESRMVDSLLRLHFHDCFVQGCDGSILLDSTSTIDSEKDAIPNKNSVRGFEVIDYIKTKVDKICGRSIVSCADILAVAARDSVVLLGGRPWKVKLGRKDSTTANSTLALLNLPNSSLDLPAILTKFEKQGLNAKDLVVLSGGHTLGLSECRFFRTRIYNDTDISPRFARNLRKYCPSTPGDGDFNLEDLDETPNRFDRSYFKNILKDKALLHSDQVLINNRTTYRLVKKYSYDSYAFKNDFGESMIKMGSIGALTGNQGQVRNNCRFVN
jgi:peroxidase